MGAVGSDGLKGAALEIRRWIQGRYDGRVLEWNGAGDRRRFFFFCDVDLKVMTFLPQFFLFVCVSAYSFLCWGIHFKLVKLAFFMFFFLFFWLVVLFCFCLYWILPSRLDFQIWWTVVRWDLVLVDVEGLKNVLWFEFFGGCKGSF